MKIKITIVIGLIILSLFLTIGVLFIARPKLSDKQAAYGPGIPDKIDTVEKSVNEMELGNIAFNVPQSMKLHDTAVIELKLGLTTSIDRLKKSIELEMIKDYGQGRTQIDHMEGAQIQVSDRMEAHLVGTNFSITAITPDIQAVSRSDITEWKWEITPNQDGHLYLHLTLSAILSVDGTSIPKVIRTFDKNIEVEVTLGQKVSSFFENNWQWLWATILVPLAGWIWKKRKKASIKPIDN